MTSLDPTASPSPPAGLSAAFRFAPALFAATLFGSALLLFAVQPMFTKMVLPRLGGSPSVWSVAMVVFQGALLAGYAYAHLLARTLAPARGAIIHLGLLAVAAATLPIGIAQGFATPPEAGVTLWLVGLIAASVGLPFAALSASAPLLQSWFSASGHPQARNPYVLYAASNLGSFAALLAYPLVIEPLLTLREQSRLWSMGYAALALLIAAAGLIAARGADAGVPHASSAPAPSARQRFSWAALAAIPAGLVVAVTAYITTDVAAAPLLWVAPLALYLLTFVATFRERPWFGQVWIGRLVPIAVAPLAISMLGGGKTNWFALIALNLAAFVLLALACHGELYCRRPAPARLTEFYLWTSLGGVIGGIFAGLIAPNVFSGTYEYPILVVLALVAMPGLPRDPRQVMREIALPLAAAAALAAARFLFDVRLPLSAEVPFQIGLVGLAVLMLLTRHRPARFLGLVVLAFVATQLWQPGLTRIEIVRSFFGVHQVVETADGTHRLLFHGTTIHGAERVRDPNGTPVTGRPEPLTYYYFGGPISEAIASARTAQGGLGTVAVVGLGSGSLACHKRDGEIWTFFEIDPQVARIARDPNSFRFLAACDPTAPIVLGDARLTLAKLPARYDLIVLDAFSSDAIPVHLLTREALALYLSRLNAHGVIVVHISNKHMDLSRVVGAVGAAEGLVAFFKQDVGANDFARDYHANAAVAVLAREERDLGDLPRQGWRIIEPRTVRAWTDDYSDVLGAIWRKKFGS